VRIYGMSAFCSFDICLTCAIQLASYRCWLVIPPRVRLVRPTVAPTSQFLQSYFQTQAAPLNI
jgi:hypothetical protein